MTTHTHDALTPIARAILTNLLSGRPYAHGLPRSTTAQQRAAMQEVLCLYGCDYIRPIDGGWAVTPSGEAAVRSEMASA